MTNSQEYFLPSVLTQSNSYDCGVHVCRYVVNLVRMVNDAEVKMPNVKMTDVIDNFSASISGHELFGYTESDISRMRTEIYNVMAHTMKSYQNHRIHEPRSDHDPVSDSEDDEEEVEILVRETSEDTDVVMSDAECIEDASYQYQSDQDDHLSVDTEGKCSLSKANILIYFNKINLTSVQNYFTTFNLR